jgi:hypothetical protein
MPEENKIEKLTKFKESRIALKDLEFFSAAIRPLFETIHEVYSKAKLIGFLIILGGFITIILTFLAITPFANASGNEIYALASLAGLLIVSGCVLYGFLANLEYKTSQDSQEAFTKSLEIIEKSNENVVSALRETAQTRSGFLDKAS